MSYNKDIIEDKLNNNIYYGVQMLRGFAALLVVFYHATKMVHDRINGDFSQFIAGGAGVDVFFAISGFVIFLTYIYDYGKPKKWFEFLRQRMVRIIPLYWLLTCLKLVILIFSPDIAQHSTLNLNYVISSFFFIPSLNVEQRPLPLLTSGWTLPYEMLFYILFAIALAFRMRPIFWLTCTLLTLSFVGLWRTDEWGAVSVLLSPILVEFIFGMWIAYVTIKGWRMPIKCAYIMIPAMFAIIISSNYLPELICLDFRVILWGIPGALLLMSIIALESRFRSISSGIPNLIGNASYAIYLTHGFVLPFVGILFSKMIFNNIFGEIIIILLCLIISVVTGIITHVWVEKPLAIYIKQRYFRKI